MAVLKDSGERRQFTSGAVRDVSEGKGRADLLPLFEISSLVYGGDEVLLAIEAFKVGHERTPILALQAFLIYEERDLYDSMLDVAVHFEDGAVKYGDNNWKRGIPVSVYIDSATRHYLKYKAGYVDEPHDRAFMWNILCASWTINNLRGFNDFENIERSENG